MEEDYRKLKVWSKAHHLAVDVLQMAVGIPGRDHLALRTQMIGAAKSIPINALDGARSKKGGEFARLLRVSINSAFELEYHLTTARDLSVIDAAQFGSLSTQTLEVRELLSDLLSKVMKATPEAGAAKITM